MEPLTAREKYIVSQAMLLVAVALDGVDTQAAQLVRAVGIRLKEESER